MANQSLISGLSARMAVSNTSIERYRPELPKPAGEYSFTFNIPAEPPSKEITHFKKNLPPVSQSIIVKSKKKSTKQQLKAYPGSMYDSRYKQCRRNRSSSSDRSSGQKYYSRSGSSESQPIKIVGILKNKNKSTINQTRES